MLPFEFIVAGPPVSQQTRNRQRLREWQREVQQAAQQSWPDDEDPENGVVELRLTYFYEDESPDVDNIIKPIQDTLCRLVYVDDEQVVNVVSRKRRLDASFRVRGMSRPLAEGFIRGEDFLHILIQVPEDLEEPV